MSKHCERAMLEKKREATETRPDESDIGIPEAGIFYKAPQLIRNIKKANSIVRCGDEMRREEKRTRSLTLIRVATSHSSLFALLPSLI